MGQFPRYTLAGSNQFPAIATAVPAQYPVIELVDSSGVVVENVGNGPADGTWINMTLINNWTPGSVPPQYMKDSRGRVYLRGRVVSPAGLVAASACWNAPVGFRPVLSAFYADWTTGGAAAGTEGAPKTAVVQFGTGGNVIVNYTGAGAADLTAGLVTDLGRASWPTT